MRRLLVTLGVAVSLFTLGLAAIERRQAKAREELTAVDRVDFGVLLHVVRKNPVHGERIVPGAPKMTLVDRIPLGGSVVIDENGARYDGASRSPRHWFASERQAALILHETGAEWSLIEGSEGSGKTMTLAQWLWWQVAQRVGLELEGGLTAPTFARLGHVKKAIRKLWSPDWYSWKERDQAYTFVVGPTVQLVSAVKRSNEGGSPIQGATWAFCASDELQDHFEREADIEARGRSGDGAYPRICTSTPKDSAAWRDFRALVTAGKTADDEPAAWSLTKMLGQESPFISDKHWHRLRTAGTMTDREYRRRVLAEDVGPERQVYYCWERATKEGSPLNLRRVPEGAVDITAQVLRRWASPGHQIGVLIGHDPGKRQHVSVFLKAYRFPGQRDDLPRWFVVDEVTSPEVTVLTHADEVMRRCRERWRCNVLDRRGQLSTESPIALVRVDPHTRSGVDHPGQDVYRVWRQQGFLTRAAYYKPDSTVPQTIKKSERINVVNTLLAAKAGEVTTRRLFVLADAQGQPAAKKLVEAFESMETDESGEAETERKDEHDRSHWPAAVGYALYLVEHHNVGARPLAEVA